jgi:hypothetical protein
VVEDRTAPAGCTVAVVAVAAGAHVIR